MKAISRRVIFLNAITCKQTVYENDIYTVQLQYNTMQ